MADTVESAESASPLITRLVAGSLVGKEAGGPSLSKLERLGLHFIDRLPAQYARRLAAWRITKSAIPAQRAVEVTTNELCRARLADYDELTADFPVIFCGSALGGAAAHLASITGGPFLPQPFILGLQGGTGDDRLETYLEHVTPIAEAILRENPQLSAVAHFDPVHDGWLTRSLTHLRLKAIDLPLAYRDFIRRKLRPGGTIVYLDCQARWLQFRLDDRFWLQVGGWGDIPAEEFLEGSERIDRFLRASGSQHSGGWRLENHEARWEAESEWGSQPGLDKALEIFARQEGYRFAAIRFDHPHGFSKLAYRAHHQLYKRAGIKPRGVLIEMFTQYAPWTALERGLLPLWLVFNTHDSLEFLKQERASFPANAFVYLNALVTLSRTPDMAAWDEWAAALDGLNWRSIGARRGKYPEDLPALGFWLERLQNLTDPLDIVPGPLPLADLLMLAADLGHAS